MATCMHRLSCDFCAKANRTAAYRILEAADCELAPEKCGMNRRYQDGLTVPEGLLPDGTTEG